MSTTWIDWIEVRGVRSVWDSDRVPLDAMVTLIVAPNGTGKTTLCEAAELLLTGRVQRTKQRDARRNWLRSAALDPEVDATVAAAVRGGDQRLTLTAHLASDGDVKLLGGTGDLARRGHSELLELLVPPTSMVGDWIGQRAVAGRRAWVRGARFLYVQQVGHLLDDDDVDARSAVFADLLGVGAFEQQREVAREWLTQLDRRRRELRGLRADAELNLARARARLDEQAPTDAEQLRGTLDHVNTQLRSLRAQWPVLTWAADLGAAPANAAATVALLEALAVVRSHCSAAATEAGVRRQQLADLSAALPTLLEFDALVKARDLAETARGEAQVALAAHDAEDGRLAQQAEQAQRLLSEVGKLDLASSGELEAMPPAQWSHVLPEVAWSPEERVARREELLSARHLAARAHAGATERASLATRLAAPAADLEKARQAVAETKARMEAAAWQLRERGEPLERLSEAVKALLSDHRDEHECPACGHDWFSSDALAAALRRGLGPVPQWLADMRAGLEQAKSAFDATRHALADAEVAQRSRQTMRSRLAELDREQDAWRSAAAALHLQEGAAPPDTAIVDAAMNRLERAEHLLRVRERLNQLGAEAPEASLLDRVAALRSIARTRTAALAGSGARRAATRAQLQQVLQARKQALEERQGALGHEIERRNQLRGRWAALGGQGEPTQEAVEHAHTDTQAQAIALGATHDSLLEASAHLERLRRRLSLGEEMAQAERTDGDLMRRLGRLDAERERVDRSIIAITEAERRHATDVLDRLRATIAATFRRAQANPVIDDIELHEEELLRFTAMAGDTPLHTEHQLSLGQRQDLALAVFLSRARSLGGTFFLDEPFLHLDDLNRTAMLDLLRVLVLQDGSRLALVVTTASEALARHVDQKLSPLQPIGARPALRVVRLRGGPRDGVTVHFAPPAAPE